jgi:hypothetical protein
VREEIVKLGENFRFLNKHALARGCDILCIDADFAPSANDAATPPLKRSARILFEPNSNCACISWKGNIGTFPTISTERNAKRGFFAGGSILLESVSLLREGSASY